MFEDAVKALTWWPFLISSGIACLPAFPEPPVNTMRLPEVMMVLLGVEVMGRVSGRRLAYLGCLIALLYTLHNTCNRLNGIWCGTMQR